MNEQDAGELLAENGTYECAKGHRTVGEFRYKSTNAETGEVEADSGAICRVCVLEWVGSVFPTKLL